MVSDVEAGTESIQAELARALRGFPPVVCFANDWNGDPTSKHHIMRTLAAHTDVLWVEATGMRRPQLQKGADLKRIWKRLRRSVGGVAQVLPRMRVLSPFSIPLPGSRWSNRINALLYRASVNKASAALGGGAAPVLWVYTPTVAPYLSGLRGCKLVYHCVDRWWAFADYDARVMRDCHEQLCRQADAVFASSLELLQDCVEYAPGAHLLRHGVEWDHFARAALEELPRPADLADVAGPVLGFFGLIHEWVDQELLCQIASAFPAATVALIGKVQADVSRLQRQPNIRLLGQKPYAELPAYAAAFDVALIPFVATELTAAVNPIKLREYLSAGLPVVASALPEIVAVENTMLRTAQSPAEHVAAIAHFLEQPLGREARRTAALTMAGESWPGRCLQMLRLINESSQHGDNL